MKKVIFSKYTSWRKPEYQICTEIIRDENEDYVQKRAVGEKSRPHIEKIYENYRLLDGLYRKIRVLPAEKTKEGLRFAYLDGRELLISYGYHDSKKEEKIHILEEMVKEILDIRPEYLEPFQITDGFKTMFPACEPKEQAAVKVCNMDCLPSNFIRTEEVVWCLDYEWVFDFPVPLAYLRFRILIEAYRTDLTWQREYDDRAFCKLFGFTEEEIDLFVKMDECFLEYAYGKDKRYIYSENYKKKRITMEEVMAMPERLKETERQLQNTIEVLELEKEHTRQQNKLLQEREKLIEVQSEKINEYKKAMRNPFFAIKMVMKKKG